MKKILAASLSILSLAALSPAPPASAAPIMQKYCQVPPYVIQNVSPNVMLILDTSTSMRLLAYPDDIDNVVSGGICANIDNPCSLFVPNRPYYGYFKPEYWYTAGSNSFREAAAKDCTVLPTNKQPAYWDGAFLNWLTMRRIDVLRKALTGGKPSGSTIIADGASLVLPDDGAYKRIANVGNFVDNTRFTGDNVLFTLDQNGGTGTFSAVSNVDGRTYGYKAAVDFVGIPQGVLQKVGSQARFGLEFFDSSNGGGIIQTTVGATSLSAVVNQINLTNQGNGTTPVGQALWTAAGYFAQQASIPSISPPGPEYKPGNIPINANFDPMNFGGMYPRCARNFVLLITDGEPCNDTPLPSYFDGWASGRSSFLCSGTTCPGVAPFFPPDNIALSAGCTTGNYAGLEKVALWAHLTDLRNSGGTPSVGIDSLPGFQNVTFYVLNAFGRSNDLLKYAAINGGFEDDGTGRPTDNSAAAVRNWDINGDGIPDTYFEARYGNDLEEQLGAAFGGMLKRASSGTAASVLASGEGSGANLVQAVFYPRRTFGNEILLWTGGLHNLWYYVDPFFNNSTIREDSDTRDWKLTLTHDAIVTLRFDPVSQTTLADRSHDYDGDGVADGDPYESVRFEQLNYLWEAGYQLYLRNLDSRPRNIWTIDNTNTPVPFNFGHRGELAPYLRVLDDNTAGAIIQYVNGYDFYVPDAYGANRVRERAAPIYNESTGVVDNNVWKLGDIVNSTPRISSWVPLNKYDRNYNDFHYKRWTQDNTTAGSYRRRGMVFTGSNDGVLHAFKLGRLDLAWSGQGEYDKAKLTNVGSTPLGDEVWAFIPRNVLPYLGAQLSPEYCHLYTADLTPYVFDASIGDQPGDPINDNTSWRTVVIGGMRTGGGCRPPTDATCLEGPGPLTTCVKTPGVGVGSSSYYALDVTDQNNPNFMWEFSGNDTYRSTLANSVRNTLGFATTGPAIVKRYGTDRTRNGDWYAVFGSGPTGPIDNNFRQFLGRSDQPLRFFVVDMKTGELVRVIDRFDNDPSTNNTIPNAFAATLYNASADADLDYQDDVIYFGYTQRTGSAGTYSWTDGGIGRITLGDDPRTWKASIIQDGLGTVTSGIARLKNKNVDTMWLFFGTGRYFFEVDSSNGDDMTTQRKIFGIKDPCFRFGRYDNTCTLKAGALTDVTSLGNVPDESFANGPGFHGWYIWLDPPGSYTYDNTTNAFRAERIITDTVTTTAGLAFFTSYKPYGEVCGMGGKSFLWAVKYNTGGAPGNLAVGKALVQVSTASVEQIALGDEFKAGTGRDPRKSRAMEGVPPTAQGLSILTPPPPLNRVLHIRER